MTAIWGPLGWMTLHSVSTLQPEQPTPAEKQLVSQWLDLFHACITCAHCRDHFGQMLAQLRSLYPNLLDSRAEFMKAIFRAHNTVNRRLDKPVYPTTTESLEVQRKNIQARPSREYRHAYLRHIQRDWSNMRDTNGIIAMRKIAELNRIEREQWGPRDHGQVPEIVDESVGPLPKPNGPSGERPPVTIPRRPLGIARFAGGRFRFGN